MAGTSALSHLVRPACTPNRTGVSGGLLLHFLQPLYDEQACIEEPLDTVRQTLLLAAVELFAANLADALVL